MGPGSLHETEGRLAPAAHLGAGDVATADPRWLASLARVDLRGAIDAACIARLDEHAVALRALGLRWPPRATLTTEAVAALAATRSLALEVLDLSGTTLDDDDVVRLAAGRAWPTLRVLILSGAGDLAVRALVGSRAFPALRGLALTAGRITDAGALALAASEAPWTLDRLELGWNPFSAPVPGSFDPRQPDGGRAPDTSAVRALLARHHTVCVVDQRATCADDLGSPAPARRGPGTAPA